MPTRIWRKNVPQLTRRKAIRAEVHRRLDLNRNDENAWEMYHWVQGKIRGYYNVVPNNEVHSCLLLKSSPVHGN
jgi:hypothetical protein